MTFTIGHIDGSQDYGIELEVYLNENYTTSYHIPFDSGVKTISIPLNRASNIKLSSYYRMDGSKNYTYSSRCSCSYGIYDISFS